MKYKLNKKPKGIYVFVDDDKDEHQLLKLAMKELGIHNQIVSCFTGREALAFLRESDHEIFVIVSDIHMSPMDGFELKRIIEGTPELKSKCIPFFYHASNASAVEVQTAYTLNIQGYIRKSTALEETIENIRRITELWADCVHPKDFR